MQNSNKKYKLLSQDILEEFAFLLLINKLDVYTIKYILEIYSKRKKGKVVFLLNKSNKYFEQKIILNENFYKIVLDLKEDFPNRTLFLKDYESSALKGRISIMIYNNTLNKKTTENKYRKIEYINSLKRDIVSFNKTGNLYRWYGIRNYLSIYSNNNNDDNFKSNFFKLNNDLYKEFVKENDFMSSNRFIRMLINLYYIKFDAYDNNIFNNFSKFNNYNSLFKKNINFTDFFSFIKSEKKQEIEKYKNALLVDMIEFIQMKTSAEKFEINYKKINVIFNTFKNEIKNKVNIRKKALLEYLDKLVESNNENYDKIYRNQIRGLISDLSKGSKIICNNKLYYYLYIIHLCNKNDEISKKTLLKAFEEINDEKLNKIKTIKINSYKAYNNIFKNKIKKENPISKSPEEDNIQKIYDFLYAAIRFINKSANYQRKMDKYNAYSKDLIFNKFFSTPVKYPEDLSPLFKELLREHLDINIDEMTYGINLLYKHLINKNENIFIEMLFKNILKFNKNNKNEIPLISHCQKFTAELFFKYIIEKDKFKEINMKDKIFQIDLISLIKLIISNNNINKIYDDLLIKIFEGFLKFKFYGKTKYLINICKQLIYPQFIHSSYKNFKYIMSCCYIFSKTKSFKRKIKFIFPKLKSSVSFSKNQLFKLLSFYLIFLSSKIRQKININKEKDNSNVQSIKNLLNNIDIKYRQYVDNTDKSNWENELNDFKDKINIKNDVISLENYFENMDDDCLFKRIEGINSIQSNLEKIDKEYKMILFNYSNPNNDSLTTYRNIEVLINVNKIISVNKLNIKYKFCGFVFSENSRKYHCCYYNLYDNFWYKFAKLTNSLDKYDNDEIKKKLENNKKYDFKNIYIFYCLLNEKYFRFKSDVDNNEFISSLPDSKKKKLNEFLNFKK